MQHLEALLQVTIALVYNRHHHRQIKMSPQQALTQRISVRRVGAAELAQAFKVFVRAKTHPSTGQLQKLLDLWQSHRRSNAQPGFGLPEVFRELSRLLQRSVPIDQREATAIEAFYRKTGPLPAEPFRQAIDRTADALGANRALNAYLQYLDRLVQAHKDKPESEDPS